MEWPLISLIFLAPCLLKRKLNKYQSSAQGLFMLMTNGFGLFWVARQVDGLLIFYNQWVKDWQNIWLTFAAYTLVLGVVFPFVFKYKHDPKQVEIVHHS